jgi:GTP cyclohydrolase IA
MHKISLTWQDIESLVLSHFQSTSLNKYEYVYGVPRGGISIAIMVAMKSNLRLLSSLEGIDPDRVLVVDDIIDSGATKQKYHQYDFWALWNKQYDGGSWVEFPWEVMQNESPAEDSVTRILQAIGENPIREGLLETPKRVVKSWDTLYAGYSQKPEDFIKTFDSDGYDEIVLLKDIEIYSMCEHHMLPFIGKAHVAYIPDKKVLGISKLARIVETYARRLQIQERLANQVTDCLMQYLQPKAAACIIEAQHLCMLMRGVQKQNSIMVTSSLKGVFLTNQSAREELMRLIK